MLLIGGPVDIDQQRRRQGESHGFVPMLAAIARKIKECPPTSAMGRIFGDPCIDSMLRTYSASLQHGKQGEAYHAISEEGVQFRLIAEAIGRQVGLAAKSLTLEEAEGHFGALPMCVAGNGPSFKHADQEDDR